MLKLRTRLKLPDAERMGLLAENCFTPDTAEDGERGQIVRRLCSIQGVAVCVPAKEWDAADLLAFGQVWRGYGAMIKHGRRCQCHGNAARLYLADKSGIYIATGYAMSDDGVWRQHSWALVRQENVGTSRARIIETTTRRVLYWGIVLSGDQADAFARKNP